MKYSLSPREILRAEPKGFSKGLGYMSSNIPTPVIIQTLSISIKIFFGVHNTNLTYHIFVK